MDFPKLFMNPLQGFNNLGGDVYLSTII